MNRILLKQVLTEENNNKWWIPESRLESSRELDQTHEVNVWTLRGLKKHLYTISKKGGKMCCIQLNVLLCGPFTFEDLPKAP